MKVAHIQTTTHFAQMSTHTHTNTNTPALVHEDQSFKLNIFFSFDLKLLCSRDAEATKLKWLDDSERKDDYEWLVVWCFSFPCRMVHFLVCWLLYQTQTKHQFLQRAQYFFGRIKFCGCEQSSWWSFVHGQCDAAQARHTQTQTHTKCVAHTHTHSLLFLYSIILGVVCLFTSVGAAHWECSIEKWKSHTIARREWDGEMEKSQYYSL